MTPTNGATEGSTPESLSSEDIGHILAALDRSSWDQAEIVVGDVRIAVGRGDLVAAVLQATPAPRVAPASQATPDPQAAPTPPRATAAPQRAPAPPDASAQAEPGDHVVAAPSVGVFWRAPSPGAPPFVEVGARVEAGDTIGIVEVMKLMNNVASEVSGTVTAVLVENATHVEYGTPLVSIKQDG
jgi:acetyl-CoA carboxylase biotin carboxyl carrier protein